MPAMDRHVGLVGRTERVSTKKWGQRKTGQRSRAGPADRHQQRRFLFSPPWREISDSEDMSDSI